MRIGICAALQVDTTVHARGFLHGVLVAACALPGIRRAQLTFFDDGAGAEGGAQAADAFLRARVDAVVGHFASASAAAAIDRYEAAGIPLLLPASTRAQLTRRGGTAFRICASDDLIARHLVEVLRSHGVRRVWLDGDDSLHGRSQLEALHAALGPDAPTRLASSAGADAIVYCGRLRASRIYLETQRALGNRAPIYFTDDAASGALVAGIAAPGPVYVVSFPVRPVDAHHPAAAAYAALFHRPPLLYAMETVAAFAAIEQAANSSLSMLAALRTETFSTPLGRIRFVDGENRYSSVSLWHADGDELKESTTLAPLDSVQAL